MSDSNVIDSPRNNDAVECCNVGGASGTDPVLDFALGHATTLLEVVDVRARVNSAPWTHGNIVFSEALDPGGFATAWEVGVIPKVSLAGSNQLEVEIKRSNGTWLAASPVNFTAFCTMNPVVLAANERAAAKPKPAARLFIRLGDAHPPTTTWALLTSQLADSQKIKLQRKGLPTGGLSVWTSSRTPKPTWKLRMLTPTVAELILRLKVRRKGSPAATLVQRWVSGKFSPKSGGDFLPTGGTLPIPMILEARRQ